VYIDGESGQISTGPHPRNYYLGVTPPPMPVAGHKQVYYIAQSTLRHPYSANDFLKQRKTTRSPHFLVYLNTHCVSFRQKAFDALVHLAKTHQIEAPVAQGACYGQHKDLQHWLHDKKGEVENVFLKMTPFRFALVMENHNVQGYVTEKIANAFMASTIPIYYGTPEIFEMFNKDAFIYYDIKNPQPSLDKILYLETNQTAYAEVLAQPILANGEKTLEDYFSLSKDIGGGKLIQKIREMVLK
jgi:hypothetical protein